MLKYETLIYIMGRLVSCKVWSSLSAIFILMVLSSLLAARADGLPILVQDFLEDDGTIAVALSPDGKRVALIIREFERDDLYVASVERFKADKAPYKRLTMSRASPSSVIWLDNDTLFVTFQLAFIDVDRRGQFKIIPFVYGSIMSAQTGDQIAPRSIQDDEVQSLNSSIVNVLASDREHALMSHLVDGDMRLSKLNIKTGVLQTIDQGDEDTLRWYTDTQGHPVFKLSWPDDRTRSGFDLNTADRNEQPDWVAIETQSAGKEDADLFPVIFEPISPAPAPEQWYVFSRLQGEERVAIRFYNTKARTLGERAYESERFDLSTALSSDWDATLLGYGYTDDRLKLMATSALHQRHIDALERHFEPQQSNILPIGQSTDAQHWLLFAEGPRNPGTFYTYDLEPAHLTTIGSTRKSLEDKAFGPVQSLQYTTRDGLTLKGYLSRPKYLKEGEVPPLIVMPHGGPNQRDSITFNPLVQLLTLRGYQVFQPNFRGSSGFGVSFAKQSEGMWNKAVLNDVLDGTKMLFERQLADPKKSCVMGGSFGAYLAMSSVTHSPDLFKCAVGIAGVYDLRAALKAERRKFGRKSAQFRYWQQQIGDYSDKGALKEMSPTTHADKVRIPVLLIHGVQDQILKVKQSKSLYKRLKRSGAEASYLALESSGHSDRTKFDAGLEYSTVLSFLAEHLPTRLNYLPQDAR